MYRVGDLLHDALEALIGLQSAVVIIGECAGTGVVVPLIGDEIDVAVRVGTAGDPVVTDISLGEVVRFVLFALGRGDVALVVEGLRADFDGGESAVLILVGRGLDGIAVRVGQRDSIQNTVLDVELEGLVGAEAVGELQFGQSSVEDLRDVREYVSILDEVGSSFAGVRDDVCDRVGVDEVQTGQESADRCQGRPLRRFPRPESSR